MSSTTYRQLVLRLPDGLKQAMRDRVESGFGLDGVEFTPVKKGSRRFTFTMNGETYPARLVDLPCVLETQKTLDKTTFFKSGDVGQMLIVYKLFSPTYTENGGIQVLIRWDDNAYKRDEGSASGVGPQDFFPDSLTPPTKNIVRRRFLKARPDRRNIDRTEVICVESQVLKMQHEGSVAETSGSDKAKRPGGGGGSSSSSAGATTSNGGGSSRSGGGSSSRSSRTGGGGSGGGGSSSGGGSGGAGDKVTFEHEEIVEFEPWMVDPEVAAVGRLEGITIEVTGPTQKSEANDAGRGSLSHPPPLSAPRLFGSELLYQHPEMLLAKADFIPDTGTARSPKKLKVEEGSADATAVQAGAGATGVGKKPGVIKPEILPGSKPGVIKPEIKAGSKPGVMKPEIKPGSKPGVIKPRGEPERKPGAQARSDAPRGEQQQQQDQQKQRQEEPKQKQQQQDRQKQRQEQPKQKQQQQDRQKQRQEQPKQKQQQQQQQQQPSRLNIAAAETAKPADTAGDSAGPLTPCTDLGPDADVALNHMDDPETLDELGVEDIFLGVSGDLDDDLPT